MIILNAALIAVRGDLYKMKKIKYEGALNAFI
jgi:hypothetical protein